MLNKVTLIGNLGRDPETRRLGNGNPVVSLRIATSESWKDKATGERKDKVEWHSVTIYNEGLCRIVEQYAKKGSRLYVEGSLSTRKWQHADGTDRYSTEVVLGQFNGTIKLLGDPSGRAAPEESDYGTTRTREESGERRPSGGGAGAGSRPNYDLDDDIPF